MVRLVRISDSSRVVIVGLFQIGKSDCVQIAVHWGKNPGHVIGEVYKERMLQPLQRHKRARMRVAVQVVVRQRQRDAVDQEGQQDKHPRLILPSSLRSSDQIGHGTSLVQHRVPVNGPAGWNPCETVDRTWFGPAQVFFAQCLRDADWHSRSHPLVNPQNNTAIIFKLLPVTSSVFVELQRFTLKKVFVNDNVFDLGVKELTALNFKIGGVEGVDK